MYTPDDLKALLVDIFADGYVDPEERERLRAFQEKLSGEATLQVCRDFMTEKWGEAMKDGVLSADEKRLMTHIIEELALDLDHLPEQARIALRDD